ncbi:MAG: hypothetical protein DWI57_03125 [Chloroflexi bacterium]|nr:MAG: hypothetical protein DWI57_03125 [Chloroflexota bacterium]
MLAAQQTRDIVFGAKVRLLGFDLGKTVYRPGERMRIRLYWQAEQPLDTDYTTFVHLDTLSSLQTRVTSDNEAPGDAQSQMDIPSSGWDLNRYVRDEHRFPLPVDLPPLVYQVRVGLYNPRTGERLAPSTQNGDVLTTVHIVADPQTKPTVRGDGLRLGDSIHLQGYAFAGEEAREIVCSAAALAACLPHVTLYWRSDAASNNDLTVLLHLIGPDGALYGQGDGPPLDGLYPTSLWLPGQTIADTHTLLTQPNLPPGEYRIVTGLYRPENGERLPSAGPDGPLPDGLLPLAGLVVKIVE